MFQVYLLFQLPLSIPAIMVLELAVGVYQHEKSERLDEYLAALEVPWMAK